MIQKGCVLGNILGPSAWGPFWPISLSHKEFRQRRHRPKPPLYRLDTLCGKAPKVRHFCQPKNVGKGESHGPKSVKPSPPCISLLWDGAAASCGAMNHAQMRTS